MYFYLPDFEKEEVRGQLLDHFISCRVKKDDVLEVTDLNGGLGKIKILSLNKKDRVLNFTFLNKSPVKRTVDKVLFQAITDKQYLEKMVELCPIGEISIIILFKSKRSPKSVFDLSRLNKILQRSCLQSHNPFLPTIKILKTDLELIELLKIYKPSLLDISGNTKTKNAFNACLVGPEGGFTLEEIENFKKIKLDLISLGDKVLPAWLAGFTALN
jgi:RsmE family RNA methyltransferase